MGHCASVANENRGGSNPNKPLHRLLLLGAGEAGKSTVFKAIKISKKGGFDEKEQLETARLIFRSIVKFLQLNICRVDLDGVEDGQAREELGNLSTKLLAIDYDHLPDDLSADMKTVEDLWEHQIIRQMVDDSPDIDESTTYIFDNFDRFCKPGAMATETDILQFRNPTTNFSEVDYENDSVVMRFIDVGGQRKERLKWNSVGKVTAVIFVVALDEYNKTLVEDVTRNRMKESLLLFRMISTKHFNGTPVILFLNKRDLFEKKIKNVDLNVCFPDYTGGCDYDNALQYIEGHFREVASPNEIYVNVTCATDVNQMEQTFAALEQIVFSMNVNANF